jgi:hypothetical protein
MPAGMSRIHELGRPWKYYGASGTTASLSRTGPSGFLRHSNAVSGVLWIIDELSKEHAG